MTEEDPTPDLTRKWRVLLTIGSVLFPLLLFCFGQFFGLYIFKDKWMQFMLENFNITFGVPMSVVASLAVVILLQTNSKGSLTIKGFGFELSGPSVPIILW